VAPLPALAVDGGPLATWDENVAEVVLARVNGAAVTMGDVRSVAPREKGALQPFDDVARRSLLQRAIDVELLYQLGTDLDLQYEPSALFQIRRSSGVETHPPAGFLDVEICEGNIPLYAGGTDQVNLVLAVVGDFEITGAYLDRWSSWLQGNWEQRSWYAPATDGPQDRVVWPPTEDATRKSIDAVVIHLEIAHAALAASESRPRTAVCSIAKSALYHLVETPRLVQDISDDEARRWYEQEASGLDPPSTALQVYAFAGLGTRETKKMACEAFLAGTRLPCVGSSHFSLGGDPCVADKLYGNVMPRQTDERGRHRELQCVLAGYPNFEIELWQVPELVVEQIDELDSGKRTACLEDSDGDFYVYEAYTPIPNATAFDPAHRGIDHRAVRDWNRDHLYEPLLEDLRSEATVDVFEERLKRLDFLPEPSCVQEPRCLLGSDF